MALTISIGNFSPISNGEGSYDLVEMDGEDTHMSQRDPDQGDLDMSSYETSRS